jgi:hypothetical protein
LQNNVWIIKSNRRRLAGHVTCWGRGEKHTGFRFGNLREGNYLKDPDINGRIILKWIFKEQDGMAGTGFLRIGTYGQLS